MRTDTGILTMVAARSVMAEVAAGRPVDPLRVQWAEDVLKANATDLSSRPETCGCELCAAWRKERGLARMVPEELAPQGHLRL